MKDDILKDDLRGEEREALREAILKREWFHTIDLGDGLVTPGRVPLEELHKLAMDVGLPQDFTGKRVLDIGAWDGFFSFEAERRGASEVLAIDVVPLETTGFALAKKFLNSKARYQQLSVYDLAPQVGKFDVVLFFGVWYHLRYPILAIDRIWEVLEEGGDLYLESACLDNYLVLDDETVDSLENLDPALSDTALLQFYRLDELNPGDFSNWFSFSRKAVEDILLSAGFEVRSVVVYGARIRVHAIKRPGPPEYKQILSYEAMKFDEEYAPSAEEIASYERRRKRRKRRSLRRAALQTQPEELARKGECERERQMRALLAQLRHSRGYRWLRRLGFWGWLDDAIKPLLEE